ncbi:hypothetical protein ACR780_10125 [Sphingobacterium faecium]|uniref:hypothetical protein n=1 Tax=Sphingobacterium faecium TaxID=34087 RepID=UPI003DA6CD34
MNKEIFNSKKSFVVFDYFISHGQLLIRSKKSDNQKYNIDIIFFNTSFLQLFTFINGITIKIVNKSNFSKYDSVVKYLEYDNSNLFEITSSNEKYYIAASFVQIFENELEFNETSLGMIYKGRERKIAEST